MIREFIGIKRGMTQIFNKEGEAIPVTIIELQEHIVIEKKTEEKNGYNALKVGSIDVKKPKKIPKPIKGLFKNEKKKIFN